MTTKTPEGRSGSRPVQFTRFGVEPLEGQYVCMPWRGRELLGEVRSVRYVQTRGVFECHVTHFNGQDWPMRPVAGALRVIA